MVKPSWATTVVVAVCVITVSTGTWVMVPSALGTGMVPPLGTTEEFSRSTRSVTERSALMLGVSSSEVPMSCRTVIGVLAMVFDEPTVVGTDPRGVKPMVIGCCTPVKISAHFVVGRHQERRRQRRHPVGGFQQLHAKAEIGANHLESQILRRRGPRGPWGNGALAAQRGRQDVRGRRQDVAAGEASGVEDAIGELVIENRRELVGQVDLQHLDLEQHDRRGHVQAVNQVAYLAESGLIAGADNELVVFLDDSDENGGRLTTRQVREARRDRTGPLPVKAFPIAGFPLG